MFSLLLLLSQAWIYQIYTVFRNTQMDTFFDKTATSPTKHAVHGRTNIWRDMNSTEAVHLLHWLYSDISGLKLTDRQVARANDNILLVTELLRPNKTDAIAFLDQGRHSPTRFARITVKRNSVKPPDVAEFMVGPLSSDDMRIQPLAFPYNSGRSTTTNPASNIVALTEWIDQVAIDIADIVQDLFGRPYTGLGNTTPDSFEASSNDQINVENGRYMRWVTFFQTSDANTLLPQGLYFKADTTGEDVTAWKVVMWLYNGVLYNSTLEFRRAWSTPGFEKLSANIDGSWTVIEPDASPQPEKYSSNKPPMVIQPGDSRIEVDPSQDFISWMGFTFNYAFSQVNGVALYDIRLDGERVMFELSLQEAMAHYAGNDPIQSSTSFLDSLFGIGAQATELVPGFDCPKYAHFFNLTYYRMGRRHTRTGAMCVFESPTDYPLQRHTRGRAVTSFTNSILIVRTIAVVGNYDYLLDYIMYLGESTMLHTRGEAVWMCANHATML